MKKLFEKRTLSGWKNARMKFKKDRNRTMHVAAVAVAISIGVSFIARVLVSLIDLVTQISFFGKLSLSPATPAANTLGWTVIFIPAAGGLIVGLMTIYGSKAIRGHGIPEAMEQILTNRSKIKPTITYLKPISSAIAIGTGGPFGAEGPIIATGGALGSTIGQLIRVSDNERKILLAAGAAAGMSAIFGSPLAAIFLSIELLLFEFSPRSIIPVSLACITGAAGHYFLFGAGPVFAIHQVVEATSNNALLAYSGIGAVIGVLSVGVTKAVYFTEDLFERIPVHWMWWPAVGGLMVGLIGYAAPRTLGVGYQNISDILGGTFPLRFVVVLCLLKFLSWVIALGSGTSGGTLAPLLTIGAAAGAVLGIAGRNYFPHAGITVTMGALVGMSAMFAGASRAFLTSVIFALETTGQFHALLPLLACCSAAYIISFFLMENTIMTEKIARRGVRTPHSYEPDVLEKANVDSVMTIFEPQDYHSVSTRPRVNKDDHLRTAIEKMLRSNVDLLDVVSNNRVVGSIGYKEILSAYLPAMEAHEKKLPSISLKRKSLRLLATLNRLHNQSKTNSV